MHTRLFLMIFPVIERKRMIAPTPIATGATRVGNGWKWRECRYIPIGSSRSILRLSMVRNWVVSIACPQLMTKKAAYRSARIAVSPHLVFFALIGTMLIRVAIPNALTDVNNASVQRNLSLNPKGISAFQTECGLQICSKTNVKVKTPDSCKNRSHPFHRCFPYRH